MEDASGDFHSTNYLGFWRLEGYGKRYSGGWAGCILSLKGLPGFIFLAVWKGGQYGECGAVSVCMHCLVCAGNYARESILFAVPWDSHLEPGRRYAAVADFL